MNQTTSAVLIPFFYPPYRPGPTPAPSQDPRPRLIPNVWISGARRRPSTFSIDPELALAEKFTAYTFNDSQRPPHLSLKLYEGSGAGESARVGGVLSRQSDTGDGGRGGSRADGVRFGLADVSGGRVDKYGQLRRALLHDASLVLGVPPDQIAEDVKMWVREPKLGGTTSGVWRGSGDAASAADDMAFAKYVKRRSKIAFGPSVVPRSGLVLNPAQVAPAWWPQWTHILRPPTLRVVTATFSTTLFSGGRNVWFEHNDARNDSGKSEVTIGDVGGRRIDRHCRDEYWVAFEARVRYQLQREGRLPVNSGTSWFEAEVAREVARHEESAFGAASAGSLTGQAEASLGGEESNERRGAMGEIGAFNFSGGDLSAVVTADGDRDDRDGDARASRRTERKRRNPQQQAGRGGDDHEGEERHFWRTVDGLVFEEMERRSFVGYTLLRMYDETVRGHIRLMGVKRWPELRGLYERFYSPVLYSTFPEESRISSPDNDNVRLTYPLSSREGEDSANYRDDDVISSNVATKAVTDPELHRSGDSDAADSGSATGDGSDDQSGFGWVPFVSQRGIEKWIRGWKGYFPVVPGTAGINSLEVNNNPGRTQQFVDPPPQKKKMEKALRKLSVHDQQIRKDESE